MRIAITIALLVFLLFALAYAHEEQEHESTIESFTHDLKGLDIVAGGMVLLLLFVGLAVHYKNRMSRREQKVIFILIALVVAFVTLYLLATTILLNMTSVSAGPVHWHADFEVWACGERIELHEPEEFLSNRVGSGEFHHHDDDRIHVEGLVLDWRDVSLGRFFDVIGGSLTSDSIAVPTENGIKEYHDGDLCGTREGVLQVFVYRTRTDAPETMLAYEQVKLENFEDYVLSPYANVPPGDCIIIEFGEEKERTDKICETYMTPRANSGMEAG